MMSTIVNGLGGLLVCAWQPLALHKISSKVHTESASVSHGQYSE